MHLQGSVGVQMTPNQLMPTQTIKVCLFYWRVIAILAHYNGAQQTQDI